MKKIISTAALAMFAFVSVVTMSSCQKDSPSSFNAAPMVKTVKQQPVKTNTKDFGYQATPRVLKKNVRPGNK